MKNYIDVICLSKKDGTLIPLYVVWNDIRYKIDKVGKSKKWIAAAGGIVTKYEVYISGQRRILCNESGRWFVDRE